MTDQLQEPRITILVLQALAGPLFEAFSSHYGRLRGLLGPLPGGPGLAFDQFQLLEFGVTHLVKVADGRFSPGFPDGFQIATDGGLAHLQMIGNRRLRPALQVQLGDLPVAVQDGEVFMGFVGHLV